MGLNIYFLLDKRRAKSDLSYPLIMRVVYNRKPLNIATGYSLIESDWDDKKGRIKTSCQSFENVNRINSILTKKRTKAYDLITKLEDEGKLSLSNLNDVRKILIGKKDNNSQADVFSYIESIVSSLIQANRIGNAGVYKLLLSKLKSTWTKKSLRFTDIDYKFLKKMETIHYSKNNGSGGLSVYLRTLRAVYNKAIKEGIADKQFYPFKDYKIKSGTPNRRALTEDEISSLKDHDFSGMHHLQKTRDLYLSSFYLRGINWMDMAHLKVKNIIGDFDRISYLRQKTKGVRFSIKINEPVKKIILSFLDEAYQLDDYLFPILKKSDPVEYHYSIIENRRKRLNKNLKEIAAILKIPKFTIYSARHTYAMTLKRKGAPTSIIQDSLGHTTEQMTQTYLDSFENDVIDQYDRLIL